MKRRKILTWLMIVFSVLGIAASVESTIAHYNPGGISEFCSINETFDCDAVNTSKYSELMGIPVAVLGLLAYGFLFIASILYLVRDEELLLDAIVGTSVLGFLFSLYLTYIEAFVLKTWCLVCISSQIAIFIIMIASITLRTTRRPAPSFKSIHE